jgi:hypothetical protein
MRLWALRRMLPDDDRTVRSSFQCRQSRRGWGWLPCAQLWVETLNPEPENLEGLRTKTISVEEEEDLFVVNDTTEGACG